MTNKQETAEVMICYAFIALNDVKNNIKTVVRLCGPMVNKKLQKNIMTFIFCSDEIDANEISLLDVE